MTPDVVVQLTLPDSKPGLRNSCPVGGGGGGGGGVPPKIEYSSRFGDPLPGLRTTPLVELLISALATADGVAVVFVARYSAATPATCGVAIDVPLIVFV